MWIDFEGIQWFFIGGLCLLVGILLGYTNYLKDQINEVAKKAGVFDE